MPCGSSIRRCSSGCATFGSWVSRFSSIPAPRTRASSTRSARTISPGARSPCSASAASSRACPRDECAIVRAAALLHDVGHYPFSHALEEIGALHHEAVARTLIIGGEIAAVLASSIGANAAMRAHAIITGESESPLQGLISGSLDLDKIEYLKRDALMCGVPYGEIDVDRLLHSLTIVEDPASGALAIGIVEKGLAALESLLFAKYQMYRNVYWHHAVRSATAMYKRLVEDAMRTGAIEERELAGFTDEGLLHRLEERAPSTLLFGASQPPPAQARLRVLGGRAADRAGRLDRGRARARARGGGCARARARRRAGRCAARLSREAAHAGTRSPVRMRGGEVRRLGASGWPAAINLPLLAQELYESTRVMRVFATEGTKVPRELVVELLRS